MKITYNKNSDTFGITDLSFDKINDLKCFILSAGISSVIERFRLQCKEVYTNREDTFWCEHDIRNSKKIIRLGRELKKSIQRKFNELYNN